MAIARSDTGTDSGVSAVPGSIVAGFVGYQLLDFAADIKTCRKAG